MNTNKQCTLCKIVKPLDEFHKQYSSTEVKYGINHGVKTVVVYIIKQIISLQNILKEEIKIILTLMLKCVHV